MSAISLIPNNTNTVWNFGQNRGISEYAKVVSDSLDDLRKEVKNENESFGSSLIETLKELDEAALDASVANWDGFGGKKIDKESYINAQKFLNNLPVGVSMPEVSIHPDGEVALEWFKNRKYVLTVSISSDEEIAYAFRFGLSKGYEKKYFGDDIPETVLEKIKEFSFYC